MNKIYTILICINFKRRGSSLQATNTAHTKFDPIEDEIQEGGGYFFPILTVWVGLMTMRGCRF